MNSQHPVYVTASMPVQESAGLFARVENVAFAPALDAPADRPFPFIYSVAIFNQSGRAITIKGRKWVVRELVRGRCHVVEGDGVAGCRPRLEPGESFRYESYHVVASDSVAEGAFLAFDDAGRRLLIRAPAFKMSITA